MHTRMGILRVAREVAPMVGAAMFCCTEIPGKSRCFIQILHVGGTIKHCEQQAIVHNKKKLQEMLESGELKREKMFQLLEKSSIDIHKLNSPT